MNKRKTILQILSIVLILVLSNLKGATLISLDNLPDAEDIDGNMLANVPSVDVAISSFQVRIKQNPQDAVTYTLLANQYMRQARETGDVTGYQRAETALKEALALLPTYSPASTSLASVYYAQHDFTQALELAQKDYEKNPKNTQAFVVIGDAQLALGNYKEAEAAYQELNDKGATPPVLARLAVLEELKGDPQQGLEFMRRAAGDALQSGGTRESVAWYLLRVGDMYFNTGQHKQAGAYYESALRIFDNYHLALAGLGRVSATQGKYDEAVAYYQQAVNIIPQPDYLSALGDLYVLTNQTEKAQIQYKTVEYIGKLADINKQVYNRQLANFYSDHDLHVQEGLRLALSELESRKDIYGYDAAAWAQYQNGNFDEAQELMDQAMALGTRDALLYYHAGMIALELSDKAQARKLLAQALEINPHFSILHSDRARVTLESLEQQTKR
jgi:tetratricopeptide (TPR) repeat protein